MKVLSTDISGKVYRYDEALYQSVVNNINKDDAFVFGCPYFSVHANFRPLNLYSLVPSKYRGSSALWKRLIKIIEGIINYIVVLCFAKKEKTDIVHLQWLPFLEFCSLERWIIKLLKRLCPEIKVILTIHNVYPHNSSEIQKRKYKNRILKIIPMIDAFIVHNNTSKRDICYEFGIKEDSVFVIHHGIFVPDKLPLRKRDDNKIRLLLFGQQSLYKGTDILINAVELLPLSLRSQIEFHIIGDTDSNLYKQYVDKTKTLPIVWTNQFVSDDVLYQELQNTDLIIYPYRAIAQSGALLLGLYFKKPVIISDLPAFRETLGKDYPEEFVCEVGDAQSLADTISKAVQNLDKLESIRDIIQNIIVNNSWESASQKTINLYQQCL